MKLPPQPWADSAGAQAILAALDAGAGTTRLVGGAVRDALLGLAVKDIDLATQLPPDDVARRLQAAGLKAVPTGIAHGTVTAVAPGITMEVTTLRRDVATDGRHATVAFTTAWAEDARRRDFTINALFARLPGGEIDDFHGGLADLAARRVRFIGLAEDRIAEDHLRILRFFRFHARFGAGVPDAAGLAACTARARDLMALSRERIAAEMRGLLLVGDPAPTVALMIVHAILAPVLPEITPERVPVLARTIAAEAASGVKPAWTRRLAALLPPEPHIAETVAARLRLSNADRRRVALAAAAGDGSLAEAWAVGTEAAIDRCLIAGDAEGASRIAAWQRPHFPVGGRDLLARGVSAGPDVARLLGRIEADWVAADFPADAGPLIDAALAGRGMG